MSSVWIYFFSYSHHPWYFSNIVCPPVWILPKTCLVSNPWPNYLSIWYRHVKVRSYKQWQYISQFDASLVALRRKECGTQTTRIGQLKNKIRTGTTKLKTQLCYNTLTSLWWETFHKRSNHGREFNENFFHACLQVYTIHQITNFETKFIFVSAFIITYWLANFSYCNTFCDTSNWPTPNLAMTLKWYFLNVEEPSNLNKYSQFTSTFNLQQLNLSLVKNAFNFFTFSSNIVRFESNSILFNGQVAIVN